MTANSVPQQQPIEEQRPEPPRVLMAPEWVLAQNLFGGIGAGIVAYCYPQLQGDTWGSVAEAVAVAGIAGGGLCIIRFGIDEIALLTRVIVTQSLIASKRAREWRGRRELEHDLRVAFAYADRMEKERNQTQARLSLLEKKKSGPHYASNITWDPNEPDPVADSLREWMSEGSESEEADDIAPTIDLDDSIEQCFSAANELLTHYEKFGSLAKGNAYQNSGITNRVWDKAKQIMLDAGAARMDGNALVLAAPTVLEAELLLDSYREQLARQLHG